MSLYFSSHFKRNKHLYSNTTQVLTNYQKKNRDQFPIKVNHTRNLKKKRFTRMNFPRHIKSFNITDQRRRGFIISNDCPRSIDWSKYRLTQNRKTIRSKLRNLVNFDRKKRQLKLMKKYQRGYISNIEKKSNCKKSKVCF